MPRRILLALTPEVVRPSRWLRVPDGVPLPETLTMPGHAAPEPAGPPQPTSEVMQIVWFDPDSPDVILAAGMRWRLGCDQNSAPGPIGSQEVVAACSASGSGRRIRSWRLGPGTVAAVADTGDGVAVAVARPHVRGTEPARTEVLLLAPDAADEPRVLLRSDAVNIAPLCWPLAPRPIEADSYTHRVLAANDDLEHFWHSPDGTTSPLATDLAAAQTELVGGWPDVALQWTFSLPRYPGLRLRRRVPLFDELGRVDPPEHAAIQLMEDVETAALPPATDARARILAI